MDIDNQKKYIVEVLGKRLICSDIKDERTTVKINGKQIKIHRYLAMKYWPEIELTPSLIVHHIDGNHYNNTLSNLVIVTKKEHCLLHKLFGSYGNTGMHWKQTQETIEKRIPAMKCSLTGRKLSEEHKRKIGLASKQRPGGFTGHHHTEESKSKISKNLKQRKRPSNDLKE